MLENDDSPDKQALSSLNYHWQDYYQLLSELPPEYELAQCLKLLNIANEIFTSSSFSQTSQAERLLIAGIFDHQVQKSYPFNSQLLGDMSSFASFKKLVKTDPDGLSKLLNIIPSSGNIDGWHFKQFVDSYQQIFTDNGFKQAQLFPATRLLCMKRPDQFISLTQTTATSLCESWSIRPLKANDFQRYWDEIIVKMQQTSWYKSSPPSAEEFPVYQARVALFERLLTTPSHIPQNEKVAVTSIEANDLLQHISGTSESPKIKEAVLSDKTNASKIVTKPQPKALRIKKKQSAKVNLNAATKLMSQYYFANKAKFAHLDMRAKREEIIQQLIDGESVEEVFARFLSESL